MRFRPGQRGLKTRTAHAPASPPRPLRPLRNERGVALILAIGMTAVLSLLGVVVMDTATQEMAASGQYGARQHAFYAAERAVEYSLNREMILAMGGSTIDLYGGTDPNGNLHRDNITPADGIGRITAGTVIDAGPGELPVRLAAAYGTDFGANYYDISVTAEGPGNSLTHIDSQVVRLFKLDDDSIFITKGSGQ